MKVHPTEDRVLVRKYNAGKTPGGILIPETARSHVLSRLYEVVAVGPGRYEAGQLIEPRVKVGDLVAFTKRVTEDGAFHLNGEDVAIVPERDIAAVFEVESSDVGGIH